MCHGETGVILASKQSNATGTARQERRRREHGKQKQVKMRHNSYSGDMEGKCFAVYKAVYQLFASLAGWENNRPAFSGEK